MPRTKKTENIEDNTVIESSVSETKMSEQQMLDMIANLTAQVEKLTKEKKPEKEPATQYVGSRMDAPCSLIHLMDCTPNLPTTLNVNGREVPFTKFGEKRSFRFADIQDIVSHYRDWFERGLFVLGEDCKPFEAELGIKVKEIPLPPHKYSKLAQLPLDEFTSVISSMPKPQAVMLAKVWIERYNNHVDGYDNFEYVRILNKKTDGFMREFMSDLVDFQK